MATSKEVCLFCGHFECFLLFFDIFGTVYEEIAMYIDIQAFLKTFDDKRSLFLYYDEVLLIFEEVFFYIFLFEICRIPRFVLGVTPYSYFFFFQSSQVCTRCHVKPNPHFFLQHSITAYDRYSLSINNKNATNLLCHTQNNSTNIPHILICQYNHM